MDAGGIKAVGFTQIVGGMCAESPRGVGQAYRDRLAPNRWKWLHAGIISFLFVFLFVLRSAQADAQTLPACVSSAAAQNLNTLTFQYPLGSYQHVANGVVFSSVSYPLENTPAPFQYTNGPEGAPAPAPNVLTTTFTDPANGALPASATNVSFTASININDRDDLGTGTYAYIVTAFDIAGKPVWSQTYSGIAGTTTFT